MINECRHSWESILSDIAVPDDQLLLASVVFDLTSQACHKVLQYLGGNASGYTHEPTENQFKFSNEEDYRYPTKNSTAINRITFLRHTSQP